MKSFPLMSALLHEHAGKNPVQLEHLSKSERKVAEVILASPLRPFIQASPPWRRKRASANRRLTASAAAWKRAAFLILNCIWHKVWRTARSMLTAMSMKTTALSHTRENI
jgi:hypothetical protein